MPTPFWSVLHLVSHIARAIHGEPYDALCPVLNRSVAARGHIVVPWTRPARHLLINAVKPIIRLSHHSGEQSPDRRISRLEEVLRWRISEGWTISSGLIGRIAHGGESSTVLMAAHLNRPPMSFHGQMRDRSVFVDITE